MELEKKIAQLQEDNKALIRAAKLKDIHAEKKILDAAKETSKAGREARDLRQFLKEKFGVNSSEFDAWKDEKNKNKIKNGKRRGSGFAAMIAD